MENRTVEVKWWEVHDNRIELAHWLYDAGWFNNPFDVIRFFEKPWQWTPEWDEMQENLTEAVAPDVTCEHCGGVGTVDTDVAVQNAHLYTILCPDCGGSGLDAPPEWEEKHGLDDPADWAKREPDGVPTIAELYREERHEEGDEDLRPTDVVLATDPGWITP